MTRRSHGNPSVPFPRRAIIQIVTTLAVVIAFSVMLNRVPAQSTPSADPIATPVPKPVKSVPKGIPREPIEVIFALGPFLYPLALTSFIVVWFSIERLVVLRRGRVIPRPFVRRFFEHLEEGKLDQKSALKLCEENGSPIATIFAHGIRKWGKSSVEVEQAIIDGGDRQVSQLRKHLRVLNGASTVAPLLGLLGTIVGMIESFNTIATKAAMGKSEELASGIGLALLTTAAGLMISIPALVMYMYFSGRVDALVIEMDGLSQDLVDMISAEGLAEQARTPRTPPPGKPETRKAV
ncbi:MAG: MotA/TolQ/ExbB proton channel [Schlesneria sp.]|nr:MotA/TolQ/ExbB proton channel [Schlesneria sp.]